MWARCNQTPLQIIWKYEEIKNLIETILTFTFAFVLLPCLSSNLRRLWQLKEQLFDGSYNEKNPEGFPFCKLSYCNDLVMRFSSFKDWRCNHFWITLSSVSLLTFYAHFEATCRLCQLVLQRVLCAWRILQMEFGLCRICSKRICVIMQIMAKIKNSKWQHPTF